ncbi:MAG: succinylglutamate desuccinylase/aspartoacylase family protein [Vicinamibacterales bacterium]|nr:succinylglutamate desuccinylase/aspartoacylase family protein [Vicinamibacterales bacterium]
MNRSMWLRKLLLSVLAGALLTASGLSFHDHQHLQEPVVLGPGVTAVRTLGEYFEGIRGTANDINLYIIEGKEPGGTALVFGGTHPEEPAGRLAAWLVVEHAVVDRGRLIVALTANRSASTVTRPSAAYPTTYTVPTPWGGQTFRMGDRWTNPLDQWPDPEVYIHYPSGQYLAYVDVRNLNRVFPGRPNGSLTERTSFAFMELIRRERVDVAIDLHEAELQYPVISTIVTHQKGQDLATMVSMTLTDLEGFKIGTEFSPVNLHGLTHREIGDHSDAVSLLFEAPQPFLDATRGKTNAEVLLSGKDEFVVKAGKHGLLFETIDENGWPIALRVGRHTSSIAQTLETWSEDNPNRAIAMRDIPRYRDLVKNGVGFYLRDPATVPSSRRAWE